MGFIKYIYSQMIQAFLNYKEQEKRKARIALRNTKYVGCTLSARCKLIDSDLGNNVVVHSQVKLKKCTIGNHNYIAPFSIMENVVSGNYCSFGQHIQIGLPKHPTSKFVSTYPAFFSLNNLGCIESFVEEERFVESPLATTIGHDVWVGNNVIIPGGVHIGTGAIIAAGAVVVKDVEPYNIVGGNPASGIRFRFKPGDIDFLLESEWWNKDDNEIMHNANLFSDIELYKEFIRKKSN